MQNQSVVDRIQREGEQLAADRLPHEHAWSRCFDFTFPQRGAGFGSTQTSASDAQRAKQRVFDSTATDACKVGVATLQGTMIPANALWFGLDLGEGTSDAENAWLEAAAKFMWTNIHASNFDAEANDGLIDAWVAGWPVLYCDEKDGGGLYFESWPIAECYVAASRPGGLVDTIHRRSRFKVGQLVAMYGDGAVSADTLAKFNDHRIMDEVEVWHVIEPRRLRSAGSKMSKDLPFASWHVEVAAKHVLRESGYHEFPCLVPRWMRLSGSSYATGPMTDAFADVVTLNDVVKLGLMGAEVAVAPPMVAEDDGVLNPRNITMGPRKIIVANSVDSIKPLVTGARPEYADMKTQALQASVRKILMADHLPPVEGPAKTAYEWSVRVEMLRKMLGPMFGRFQAEFLQPLVERVFGIVWRANEASDFALIGKPPESLLGRSFSVKYQSPLARAQRIEEVASIDRWEVDILNTAAVVPSVLDVCDFDENKREKGKLLGVPHRLIRDAEAVQAARAQRQQAQQAQQQEALQANGAMEMQAAQAQRMANAA